MMAYPPSPGQHAPGERYLFDSTEELPPGSFEKKNPWFSGYEPAVPQSSQELALALTAAPLPTLLSAQAAAPPAPMMAPSMGSFARLEIANQAAQSQPMTIGQTTASQKMDEFSWHSFHPPASRPMPVSHASLPRLGLADASPLSQTVPARNPGAGLTQMLPAAPQTSIESFEKIDFGGMPQDLMARIEALQQKNQRLRSHHETLLRNVSVPTAVDSAQSGASGSRQQLVPTQDAAEYVSSPRGVSTRNSTRQSTPRGGPVRSVSSTIDCSDASAILALGASTRPPRQRLKARAASLAGRLKEFHELIKQYEHRDPNSPAMFLPAPMMNLQPHQMVQAQPQAQQAELAMQQQQAGNELAMSWQMQQQAQQAELAMQQQLQQQNQSAELAIRLQQQAQQAEQTVLLQQQQQLQLQHQLQMQQVEMECQRLSHFAAAEQQRVASERAVAVQLAEERQLQLQQLEADNARQQQSHQEQVLQLETALLAQSTARERELQAQLRELDEQFEEVEAADSRNKVRAAEVAELASARSFDAERWRLAATSSSPAPQPALYRGEAAAAVPESPGMPAGSAGLQLPPALPRVYEAAVSIVLQHGWHVLHGGENAGPAWTALHWAASEGRLDVCELLLRANADPGHQDEVGKTALDYALENGQGAAIAMLTSVTEVEAEASQTMLSNWSPAGSQAMLFNRQAESEAFPGVQLVAALAAQGTWPRDEQRV